MKALILVDIQNDFLPGGALAVPGGDKVISVAYQWMGQYPLVIATQDWHPADHLSFASQHPGARVGETVSLDGMEQILWPDHCVQGSWGSELAPGLDTSGIQHIVQKGTDRQIDSYSGFFDNARRRATGLEQLLRDRQVDQVDVMGLATDYCVKFTASDAVDLGFRTRLILAGCRGVELRPGDCRAAVESLRDAGVEITEMNHDSTPATPQHSEHVPVLPREVLQALAPQPGQVIVDGTLGGGGHTRLLAAHVAPGGLVLGLDRDPRAVQQTAQTLAGLPVQTVAANYADLPEVLAALDIQWVDGILLDLGLSSDQLSDHQRGFSYQADGDLDLRFNDSQGQPAWLLVQKLSEQHLADLIYRYGEERLSRRIARRIVQQRQQSPIRTARQLATLVRQCVPRSKNHDIDPATRTFQALRIAVNDELKWLEVALRRLPACLQPGGKLAVISFHSLEDRLVKNAFRDDPRLDVLTKKPLRPGDDEVQENPRSRSSRLRVAQRNQRHADDIFVHA